jgi:hypothetical protein
MLCGSSSPDLVESGTGKEFGGVDEIILALATTDRRTGASGTASRRLSKLASP